MFISPMLLHSFTPPFVDLPFEENEYISQLKIDGIRIILSKFDDRVRLYTRHRNEVTSKFPELHNIAIPNGVILDGEIAVTGPDGKPDFEETMRRFQMGNKGKQQIQYCIFDILYLDGQRITTKSLMDRLQILESIIKETETVALVKWVDGNAEAYFHLIKEHDLEGIVLKRKESKYSPNSRSRDWLKVINYKYTDAYVLAVQKKKFGLLLGLDQGRGMVPAGIMEFMTPSGKKQFFGMYRDYIVTEDEKFTYLEPKIRMTVKFRNYTKNGNLRIPSFVKFN